MPHLIYHVVVVEFDARQPDWKVFTDSAAAIARYSKLKNADEARDGATIYEILAVRLYRVEAADARQAKAKAESGQVAEIKPPRTPSERAALDDL